MAEPQTYTVARAQDGAQVRAELTLDQAKDECAMLNAQARNAVGQTVDGHPIYGSMIHGEVSRYEVRSGDGLVLA
jgi:hypothetical protein